MDTRIHVFADALWWFENRELTKITHVNRFQSTGRLISYRNEGCSSFRWYYCEISHGNEVVALVEQPGWTHTGLTFFGAIREEYSTNVYTGRLCPEVQSHTLLYTFFDEKGTPYTFYWQMVPLSHTLFRTLHPFYFYRPKWQISISFNILQPVKSLPFHIPEAWNRSPFRTEPPRIGHYREYPPGVCI